MEEKICTKHDVKLENGKCWCCEQAKQKPVSTEEKPTGVVPVATGGK